MLLDVTDVFPFIYLYSKYRLDTNTIHVITFLDGLPQHSWCGEEFVVIKRNGSSTDHKWNYQ
jgi:hypothetical protein